MVGADAAFVAKVQMHFIPGKLRAQPRVANKQGIERFGSGAPSKRHGEGAFFGGGGSGGLDEFLGRAPGGGVKVGQHSNVALHNFSTTLVRGASAYPQERGAPSGQP